MADLKTAPTPRISERPRVYLALGEEEACLNLAREEWLFRNEGSRGPILFLYVDRDAVVIGKHQNPWREANIPWLTTEGVPLTRRISGGGAVFHDRGNLNWSFMGPSEALDKDWNRGVLMEALGGLGAEVESNTRGDLLQDGKKVSGNALAHGGGVTMHHGTLLLGADLTRLRASLNTAWQDGLSLEGPSVSSVRSSVATVRDRQGRGLSPETVAREICRVWIQKLAPGEGEMHQNIPMGPEVDVLAVRYRSWDWNYGRTADFRVRWDGGVLEVRGGTTDQDLRFDQWIDAWTRRIR